MTSSSAAMNTVDLNDLVYSPTWPDGEEQRLGLENWREARCLFGLSTGRTGTTSLTYALNLSTEIAAFHEPPPTSVETYADLYRNALNSPEQVQRTFLKYRAGAVGAIHRRGFIYAETNNFQLGASVLAEILPNSVFFFLHRHPAEYVRSGMRRGWYVNHPWDAYRLTPPSTDCWSDQWSEWSPFEKICWYWQETNRYFLRVVSELPSSRSWRASFNEIARSPVDSLGPLFKRLGAEAPSAEALCEVYKTRHNEQLAGEFPLYSEWSEKQRRTLSRICGPVMEQLGYE